MVKLLRASLRRALKSEVVRLGLLAALACGLMMGLNTRMVGILDDFLILPLYVILAVVISVMVGCEHGEGSIRKMIVSGHTKGAVFFAQWILYLGYAFLITVGYLLMFGVAVAGHTGIFPFYALAVSAIGFLLVSMTYAGILVAVSIMIPSRAINAVVCILLVLATVFAIYTIDDALAAGEFIDMETVYPDGRVEFQREKNPRYVGGFWRDLLMGAKKTIPYGAMIHYTEIVDMYFYPLGKTLRLPREQVTLLQTLPLYSLALLFTCTAAGYWLFSKKELR